LNISRLLWQLLLIQRSIFVCLKRIGINKRSFSKHCFLEMKNKWWHLNMCPSFLEHEIFSGYLISSCLQICPI
jgi:hypothetical protein